MGTSKPAAAEEGKFPRYLNREVSWLSFNHRVLDEAENRAHPVLERVRFLAISDANLDEFSMVRIATLRGRLATEASQRTPDGYTLEEQLQLVRPEVLGVMQRQQQIFQRLRGELRKHGLSIVEAEDLGRDDREWLREHFLTQILPVLTPVAVDPAHPFPLIPNDGLCLVLRVTPENSVTDRWILIVLAPRLRRFIRLPGEGTRFLPLEQALPFFYDLLLPRTRVRSSGLIHVLRNSDTSMEFSENYDDLLEAYRAALRERKRAEVIRVTFPRSLSEDIRAFLRAEIDSHPEVFEMDGLLNLSDLVQLVPLMDPELRFPHFEARFPERVRECQGDYFKAIALKDMVVHHPYESFDVVVEFLEQAAADPEVLAIKQTLYRTTEDSDLVRALISAAEAGKSVTVVIELKARFDEENNIRLAQKLERSGVQVVYGFTQYKTHCKMILVLRRESHGVQGYVHFGTGNYHPVTGRLYSDISLLTCDEALVRDAAQVFNYLTGYATPDRLERLSLSPVELKESFLEMIDEEVHWVKKGRPGAIWAKMNSLVDPDIVDALYRASQAGVDVRLVVRGICILRPGVPGLSESIQVKSIVGRFLEHARIFCFGAGHGLPAPQARVFLSSADWMPRNFASRIELLIPVLADSAHAQLLDQIMMANLKDDVQSWELGPDGRYNRLHGDFSAQDYFMRHASLSGQGWESAPVPRLKLSRKR